MCDNRSALLKATGGINRPSPLAVIGSSTCTAETLYHHPCGKTLGVWGQSPQELISKFFM